MFLMGPVKQLKRMCDKTRALATTIMIVSTLKCIFILTDIITVLSFLVHVQLSTEQSSGEGYEQERRDTIAGER